MSGPEHQNQQQNRKKEWDLTQGLNRRQDLQRMQDLFDQSIRTAVDLSKDATQSNGYYNLNKTSEEVFQINAMLDRIKTREFEVTDEQQARLMAIRARESAL